MFMTKIICPKRLKEARQQRSIENERETEAKESRENAFRNGTNDWQKAHEKQSEG